MGNNTNKITNTEKNDRHPEWLMGANPGAIERQKARGQQELMISENVLPAKMLDDARQVLEAAGVTFGDPVDDDPLFQHVVLPAGWSLQATPHPLWSDLLDETRLIRARIFYKAAWYDRDAHIRATSPVAP